MNISLGPRSNQTKTAGLRLDGALPMFARDQRTGSMKQFTPGEPKDVALAPDEAGRPHSRVLVADDGEADRFLTIWQLGKVWPVEADILVECAADGAEALEKIRNTQYALVVLDWNMPQLNGADVLRAIRETDLRVPVVVVSDQCREATAGYLKTMAAAFVNKAELDTGSLRIAIAASIQLQEGRGSHELAEVHQQIHLAIGRGSRSSEAAPRAFEAARSDTRL
jgi:CheY-like chemotaxis protein